MFTHTGYKQKFYCPKCTDKSFINKRNLRVHFKSYHSELDPAILELQSKLDDVKDKPKENKKMFKCKMHTINGEICGKNFTRNVNLKYHQRNHENASTKLFLDCVHGKLTFASKANMLKHIASFHTKLVCTIC